MNLLNKYNEEGFIVVKNLIKPNKIKDCLNEINEISLVKMSLYNKKGYKFDNYIDLFKNMDILFEIGEEKYLSVVRVAANLLSIKNIANSEEIANIVKKLNLFGLTIPTDPILHVISRDLQTKNGYLGFTPHQDWPSIQGSLNSVVAWIALTPVSSESFPIQVLPKSHIIGLLESEYLKKDESSIVLEKDDFLFENNLFLDVIVEPGDVIFFSSWLIHGTGVMPGTLPRIAISTRFNDFYDETWAKRDYPSAYKRSVERSLITKNFPSLNEIKKVFYG